MAVKYSGTHCHPSVWEAEKDLRFNHHRLDTKSKVSLGYAMRCCLKKKYILIIKKEVDTGLIHGGYVTLTFVPVIMCSDEPLGVLDAMHLTKTISDELVFL